MFLKYWKTQGFLWISHRVCVSTRNEREEKKLPRIGFEPMLEDNQTCIVFREDGSSSPLHKTEHQVEQLESSIKSQTELLKKMHVQAALIGSRKVPE